jgi:hypothetical protein
MTPIEDEYVQNITEQIKEYFRKLGFTVVAIPISRNSEKLKGYDLRYELKELNKMFALQFKAPIQGTEIAWELKRHQHAAIQKKRFIFYCLPKSANRWEMPVMLFRCVFKRATFPFRNILHNHELRYCDGWGSFASRVLKCVYGLRLDKAIKRGISEEELYINFEEPIVVFGLSLGQKKELRIIANEKLLEKIL